MQTSIIVVPPIPPELRAALAPRFGLVTFTPEAAQPGFAVAVVTSMGGADRALMDRLPDLRLIACNGAGLDRVDLAEAARRGIVVRNTPDEVTTDTAEFAIGLIFATGRRLAEADRFVRSGRWAAERMPPSRRISGLRVGIVGLGRIGERIAAMAAALGMAVSYTGPRAKRAQPYRFVPALRDLATASDVLVLSCPGGSATAGIVDGEVLAALGPGGILINVSRGEVVDEPHLVAALQSGSIGGAGLDVFASEPSPDPRLLACENVVLSPHYASVTPQTRQAIAHALRDAIGEFLAGRPILDAAAPQTAVRA